MKKKAAKYRLFNSKLTSAISISMVLFMLGIISMFVLLGQELSAYVKENIVFSVIIKDSAKDPEIFSAERQLRYKPYVKQLRYISKKDALNELAAEMGEDPLEFLGYNPLPASFEINLNSDYANNDSIILVDNDIKTIEIVKSTNYQNNLIYEINHNIKKIMLIFSVIAVLLLTVSFILVNNTIRLLIYSNRFLIHTMKLVGATRHFIRKPYVYQGIMIGIIASVFAILYLAGLFYFLFPDLEMFMDLYDTKLYITVGGTILFFGIFITMLSTIWAVNKYLRHDLDDLYYL